MGKFKCTECDGVFDREALEQLTLRAESPTYTDTLQIVVCPACMSVANTLRRTCDVSGCSGEIAAGQPRGELYVYLCSEHYLNKKPGAVVAPPARPSPA